VDLDVKLITRQIQAREKWVLACRYFFVAPVPVPQKERRKKAKKKEQK
jgi:hypothetical protein